MVEPAKKLLGSAVAVARHFVWYLRYQVDRGSRKDEDDS
jgi:hypothetical protein